MAALLAGQRVAEAADEFGVPEQTVSRWKVALDKSGAKMGQFGSKNRIPELIAEYLIETLETLRKQSQIFGEREFLTDQAASEVAVLHGVLMDKSLRILEAAEAARDSERPDAPVDPAPGTAE
jgi:transposase-like protein